MSDRMQSKEKGGSIKDFSDADKTINITHNSHNTGSARFLRKKSMPDI